KGLGILPEAEAPSVTPGEGINDVNILHVDQNGSSMTVSVTWADGGWAGGLEDAAPLVDIWLAAQQSDPLVRVELHTELNIENDMLWRHELGMDWSLAGWDLNRDGELQSCVYDTRDYGNYACSDFMTFTAEDSNGANNTNDSGGSVERGEGGTVLALVLAGGLVLCLVGWLAVTSSRRKQRRKWLGTANEAEALPEDVFIRPSGAFSGFQ
ncbi:unnamed protein product, partial [Hapterophycus canaliculatus]